MYYTTFSNIEAGLIAEQQKNPTGAVANVSCALYEEKKKEKESKNRKMTIVVGGVVKKPGKSKKIRFLIACVFDNAFFGGAYNVELSSSNLRKDVGSKFSLLLKVACMKVE